MLCRCGQSAVLLPFLSFLTGTATIFTPPTLSMLTKISLREHTTNCETGTTELALFSEKTTQPEPSSKATLPWVSIHCEFAQPHVVPGVLCVATCQIGHSSVQL